MLEWAIQITYFLLGLALLMSAYRVVVGPTVLDRTAAFDTLSANLMGIIAVSAIQSLTTLNFDLAIMIALVPFMVNVIVAKFVVKGVVIDRDLD